MIRLFLLAAVCLASVARAASFGPYEAKTVLFLGDSITHAGHYISFVEARLREENGNQVAEMINLGLPSETCSGLSEPDHPFPRPTVHERLDRALATIKPDLVFACYGMNDGIYHPFSDERFAAYQQGIDKLITKVKATGAKLVLITPPPFDPLPLKKKGKLLPAGREKYAWFEIYEDYDKVLDRYSKWLATQADKVDGFIDVRTPILHQTDSIRRKRRDFTMSNDGVHIDKQGHEIFANAVLKYLELPGTEGIDDEVLRLVEARHKASHLAWLTHVGHKRPGPNSKKPFEESKTEIAAIEKKIAARFSDHPRRQAQNRPNIIIILCDDMGYSDLGCYGSEIETPNIDSLAKGGVRFTQFHNTSKCWTTRASLLTGKYWQRIAPQKFIAKECPTLPEILRVNGYRTYMSGKWHLAPALYNEPEHTPAARGFEKFYGILRGATSFFDPDSLTRGFKPVEAPRDGTYYFTDAINDDAAKNIRDHAKQPGNKPFFMYLAHTAPHWPMHALPKDIEKYRGKYDMGWQELRRRRFARMKKLGLIPANAKLSPANNKAKDWDKVDRDWEKHRMVVYAAMIDRMDQGIGRVIKSLKDTDQFDNTLIMFLSDNGASPENIGIKNGINCLGGKAETREGEKIQVGYGPGVYPGPEKTFQGYGPSWANASCTPFVLWKATSHEGGVATPFIAHWPKAIRKRGSINATEFAHLIDLVPTCLDVAGVTYPKDVSAPDGVSIRDTLTLGRPLAPRTVFNEFGNRGFMREGDWKLVSTKVNAENWELYNLRNDPTELENLAMNEPQRLARMKQAYADWYAGTGMKRNKKKK